MKKNHTPIISIGLPSLLLIFLILCLVTFSVLSLSSASADEKLSRKIADRTTEYYEASNAANDILSDIDQHLTKAFQESQNSSDYYERIRLAFSDSEDIHFSQETSVPTLHWQTTLNKTQVLSIRLALPYPTGAGDTFYEIEEWKVVNTDDWNPDLSQPVYRSNKKEGK